MKLLSFLVFLLPLVFASPTKRVDCNGGRTASDERCCVWYNVLDHLQNDLFMKEPCGNTVHESLRLTFHDAIGYSNRMWKDGKFGGGGADGSIIIHRDVEIGFAGNRALDDIVDRQHSIGLSHNISYADLIQFAGAVGITHCPGAPRLEFLAGRPKEAQASPEGLLPSPADSVDILIDRLDDAGFSKDDLVDLMIAHTIGGQELVNPQTPSTPFDTSPQVFDSQNLIETLLKGTSLPTGGLHPGEALPPLQGMTVLASDALLARDSRTACRWQEPITDQDLLRTRFRKVMTKVAVVGHKRSDLYDCSEVIPQIEVPEPPKEPHLPAGKTMVDVEVSCDKHGHGGGFPTLTAETGIQTAVHPEFLNLTELLGLER